MGIRGFYSYMRSLPGCSREVNIIEEVQKFKQRNRVESVSLVINLWTLAFHYKADQHEKLLGFRLNKIQEEFEAFLDELSKNGVEMVFLFKKSQHLEHEFIESEEARYQTSLEILDVFSCLQTIEEVAQHFQGIDKFDFPFNASVLIILVQTAKRFGILYGMDSIDNKPSTFHVQVANKHDAMAIMGTDTYYTFYGGNWKIWVDMTLDLKRGTVLEYDKEAILRSLGISVEQAPLFVALAGGLYTKNEEDVNTLSHFFRPFHRFFLNISKFVNRQVFPISIAALERIVGQVYGSHLPGIVEDFQRTLSLMIPSPDFDGHDDTDLIKRAANEYINFADQILTNTTINISPLFMDLRLDDMPSMGSLVSLWIQKTAGILKGDFPRLRHVKVLLKDRHVAKASVKKLPIMTQRSDDETTDLKLLAFISGTPMTLANLTDSSSQIGLESLVDLILLTHLFHLKAITALEVTLIMKTISDVKFGKVPAKAKYPTKLSERALRVSYLYGKIYFIFHSCLASIRSSFNPAFISAIQTPFTFDNVYFQFLFEAAETYRLTGGESMKDIISIVDKLQDIKLT